MEEKAQGKDLDLDSISDPMLSPLSCVTSGEFEAVSSGLRGWWYFHICRVVKMKLDVLKCVKHVVGAQEVLIWLFGGNWKKG